MKGPHYISQFELQLWRKAYKAIFTDKELVKWLFEIRTKHSLDTVSAGFSYGGSNYKASAEPLWRAPKADGFHVSIVPAGVDGDLSPIWRFDVKYLEEYPSTYEKYLEFVKLLEM